MNESIKQFFFSTCLHCGSRVGRYYNREKFKSIRTKKKKTHCPEVGFIIGYHYGI